MPKLYCLGDSLTYGLGVRVSQRWTRLLSAPGWETENLGVSGDTTAGMLARAQALTAQPCFSLPPAQRPAVLLMGGSNDILFSGSAGAAQSNFAALTHQLCAAGYRVLIGLPLPIFPDDAPKKWADLVDYPAAARQLEGYCRWLRLFGEAFSLPVVDLRTPFLGRADLMADGLHPGPRGHALMAAAVEEALQWL